MGRASTSLLEDIKIDYYGTTTLLSKIANITLIDANTIGVQVWEKQLLGKVEKTIRESSLGLNPTNVGDMLRVPMPPLSESRRKELVKIVREYTENGKIAIRNIRRDALSQLKNLLKTKQISEDVEKEAAMKIKTSTEKYIAEQNIALQEKEKALME